MLEFQGHQVLRLNHVGDWGTQFGMLIHYLRTHYEILLNKSSNGNTESSLDFDIGDLSTFYKAAKLEFDQSEEFRDAARQEVVNLQQSAATLNRGSNLGIDLDGDKTLSSLQIWKLICAKSREKFQEIYDLLDVSLLERGESFYNPMLGPLIERCKQHGCLEESQGAFVIFPPGFVNGEDKKPLPLIVQKSDGGYLYATTDLAALQHRIEVEQADRLIYVTDEGQSQHFKMVFSSAKLAGILPEDKAVNHVTFGLVLGQDGKKIKSRSGETIRLQDLLNEAIEKAKDGFTSRLKEPIGVETPELTTSQQEEIATKAKAMGIAAVKYADLSMNRESNYKFSFDKMLSLTGNTAPYMLYAYVRIEGIKRKALFASTSSHPSISASNGDSDLLHDLLYEMAANSLEFHQPEEIALAKHLLRSDEIVKEVAETLYPNKVSTTPANLYMILTDRWNSLIDLRLYL